MTKRELPSSAKLTRPSTSGIFPRPRSHISASLPLGPWISRLRQNLPGQNYTLRIYRLERKNPGQLAGLIEEAGQREKKPSQTFMNSGTS